MDDRPAGDLTPEQAAILDLDARVLALESQMKAAVAEIRKLMREYTDRRSGA